MNYEEIEQILSEASGQRNKKNYSEMERLCNSALNIIQALPSKEKTNSHTTKNKDSEIENKTILSFQTRILNQLSESLWKRAKGKESLIHAEKALEIAIQIKSEEEIAKAFNNIASAYFYMNDYTKAMEYYRKSFSLYEEIDNKERTATLIGNIGLVYLSISDYTHAIECFTKSLTIHQEIRNESSIADLLSRIGIVYDYLSDYPKSFEYHEKSLSIFFKLNDKLGIAVQTANIGLNYNKRDENAKALEYYTKALRIYEELENKALKANVISSIGHLLAKNGAYQETLNHFFEAMSIAEELGNKAGIARLNENIGEIYANKKFDKYDFEKAEYYIKKAIEQCEEIGFKRGIYKSYQGLSKLYKTENRWKESLLQFEKFHELEKEVQSEEATKQAQQLENRRKVEEAERDRQVKLARFQEQEKILLNILPAQIAERILEGEKQIADLHEHVSVFFSDIVGFTQLSQKITPDELLSMLNEIFSEFDRIARKHGLEKIKTIGDAYMAVAGVPTDCEDHAKKAAAFALDVIEYMKAYRKASNSELQIRVGLHCGKAIAGVIGENKFAYDLWGDSVNTASRMESHGEAGRIHVSEDFRNALSESSYKFIERGEMEVKGKGKMKTYFLEIK